MIVASPWLGLSQLILLEYYVGFSSALIMFIVSFIVAIVCGLIFSIMEDEKLFESKKRITRALLIECNCEDGDDCAVNHDAVGGTFNLLVNMLKGLFIALLLASLVKTFFTSAEVGLVFGSDVGSVLLAVPVAALMEVISEGLGVFAGQLYLLGASIGAVFTMMMVGVTADLVELKMVDTVFGRRTAFYYILVSNLVIIVGAVVLNILL